jgi:hypothetical protein
MLNTTLSITKHNPTPINLETKATKPKRFPRRIIGDGTDSSSVFRDGGLGACLHVKPGDLKQGAEVELVFTNGTTLNSELFCVLLEDHAVDELIDALARTLEARDLNWRWRWLKVRNGEYRPE